MKRKILSVLIFIALLIPSGVFAADTVDVSITGCFDYDSAYKVLELTNKERTDRGLSELSMNEQLMDAAMQRAADIAVFYSHERPDGKGFFTAIDDLDYRTAAENIAAGQPDYTYVHNDWMNSEGHRKNILTEGYRTIGIGCFYQEDIGVRTWVQLFSDNTNGGYVKTGVVTQTKTVTVKTSRISPGVYNPSVSDPERGNFYIYNRLCPGQAEEFAVMNINNGDGADFITAILDPSGYTIETASETVSINGNTITAESEGSAVLKLHIDDVFFGQYTFNVAHNFQNTAGKPATCTEAGYSGGKCTACGHEKQNEYVGPLGHIETPLDMIPPTCGKEGKSEGIFCTRCNTYLKEPETIPPLQHNYEKRKNPVTCETDGYVYYVCLNCYDSYIDENTRIPATGHLYTDGTEDPVTGEMIFTCSYCKEKYIPPAEEYLDVLISMLDPDTLTLQNEGFVNDLKDKYEKLTDEQRENLKNEDALLEMIGKFDFYHMGDITFDGRIDAGDLSLLLSEYSEKYSAADIVGEENEVNSDDMSMLLSNYGLSR